MIRPKTKLLVDGGDPQETQHVKQLLGFVNGIEKFAADYRATLARTA